LSEIKQAILTTKPHPITEWGCNGVQEVSTIIPMNEVR
jgi:hypothetical protein